MVRSRISTAVSLLGLLALVSPAAHAQRFFEVVSPPKLITTTPTPTPTPTPGQAARRARYQIGLFASFWDVPSNVRLQRTAGGSQTRFDANADTSAMLAAEIPVRGRWSVGGWVNSVGGNGTLSSGVRTIPVEFNDDLLELHVTYYVRSDLGVQVGGLREHVSAQFEGQNRSDTTYSFNAWVLKTFRLTRATGGTRRYSATGGLGYLGGKEDIANALAGVTVRLSDRWEANVFAWAFDVSDPVWRYTVGVSARF